MECAVCKFDNPPGATGCENCGRPLNSQADNPTILQSDRPTILQNDNPTMTRHAAAQGWSRVGEAPHAGYMKHGSLAPGTMLADRYEILQLLGEGGMGAVFKARDIELDRLVAIKIIRPEFAADPESLQRFKQELILSRKVTQKNVVRIFDLGQAEGVKFISMEYIEGRDLKDILEEKGTLPPDEAARLVQEVSRALDAAHSEGVIHRDLKPQNIMVEEGGRVVVMDFGIARSMDASGLTQTGALVGTPYYMSPEQAKGEKIDTRSDLFSLGIIFYQMLTGELPYKSDTPIGTLLKRVQEVAIPPVEVAPIPRPLNDIVMKCLTTEPGERYQTAQELFYDLEAWLGPTPGTLPQATRTAVRTVAQPKRRLLPAAVTWKRIAAGFAVLLVAVAGVLLRDKFRPAPAGPPKPVTVIVADFNNATGDPVFDGTLEPMVRIALEGASFVSAFDRTQFRSLGVPATDKLDEQAARQVAVSQGLGAVVSGSLDRQGGGYGLSVRAIQAVTGNPIASAEAIAPTKDQVLFAVTKVATALRKGLGDDTSESAQRFAMETITAASLEAVREYAAGMNFLSNGRFDEALGSLSKAVDLDPNFGLAYGVMASASRNLGRPQDAEKYIKLAIAHIDRMTERERYRTRGFFYLLKSDLQKCVEEYDALIARYSSDVAAHSNLAFCAADLRNLPKAIEETRQAAEILPKRSLYRGNLAIYLAFGGDFDAAEQEARAALKLDPSSAPGFIGLAYAQIGQGKLAQAADTYQELGKVSAFGSIAASGFADLALYEGRFSDAMRILDDGAAADVAAKNLSRAADKFAALAYTQISRGQKSAALAAVESALSNSKSPKIRFLAARIFVAAGELPRARELASGLASELQTEPQVYAKLIEGETALEGGDARQAIKLITEANNRLDTWIGRFDLGRAYLAAGAYAEADSEFDRCIQRRGEGLALFLNEVPSYGYFPPVYYYLGRVREGLKSESFADSYRTYLSIRGKAGEDPLLPEVRRRAGQ